MVGGVKVTSHTVGNQLTEWQMHEIFNEIAKTLFMHEED